MKKIFHSVFVILIMNTTILTAQTKFGNNMSISLYGYVIKYIAPNTYIHDTTLFTNPVRAFSNGSSCISDSNGNMLIMSNGYSVFDNQGQFIEDGDTLSPKGWCDYNRYNRYTQGSLILPMADKKYYFVNTSVSDTQFVNFMKTPGTWTSGPDVLLYHIIDMKANNGAGKVVSRMNYIIQGIDLYPSAMMACRHANGKDWWLLKQAGDSLNGNRIFKFLFTQDSVYNMGFQYLGASNAPWWNGSQMAFSPDGSKWAAALDSYTGGNIHTANFDRCTGVLSNFETHHIAPHYVGGGTADSVNIGVCFSPNGKLLYITRYNHIVQYNPQTHNQYKVWGLDTTNQAFAGYINPVLWVDGRIYISRGHGTNKQMSYIEHPDIEGIGCSFCRNCLRSESLSNFSGISHMPDYELGASVQPCWPLSSEDLEWSTKKHIKLYPNPTSTQLTIEYMLDLDEEGNIELCDIVGKKLFGLELPVSANQVSIDVTQLPKGVYLYKYIINNKPVETGKLIKE